MITAGIDVGTRFIKVALTDGENLRGYACAEMGPHFDAIIRSLLKEARVQAGAGIWDIKKIIATGFGGHLVKKAAFTLGEAACTAKAAFLLDRDIRTVVDMGGLFITVATLDQNGFLETTHVNERCAAGSGKFLETVAEAVGVPFENISSLVSFSTTPYTFTSNCAVFAESEIISQVNAGMKSGDVLAGVINAVASKAASLIDAAGAQDGIALIGGMAKIPAIREKLSGLTGRKMLVLSIDAQSVAAFGAALLAQGRKNRDGRIVAEKGF
ncbi:MAG TPA: acyl-CoA dehydratase activase [Smithella sp.]|nr:acyl-CoA dehydratase activase [Smithella sp.]HNY49141.1 acyl-CoA dehydratase activase [Smithella sp.]HOG90463.1 acyl-CoA dehydratase activase [Smithella sp.]